MSALADLLEADLKVAMRAQDEFRVGVLRMVRAELKNQEIAQGGNLDDTAVQNLVRKEVKKRRDAAEMYDKGNSPERAERETAEAALLETYLPVAPTLEVVVAKAQEIQSSEQFSTQQRGLLIKAIVQAFPGTVDGALAARAAAEVMKG